jgi:hypothetical protein
MSPRSRSAACSEGPAATCANTSGSDIGQPQGPSCSRRARTSTGCPHWRRARARSARSGGRQPVLRHCIDHLRTMVVCVRIEPCGKMCTSCQPSKLYRACDVHLASSNFLAFRTAATTDSNPDVVRSSPRRGQGAQSGSAETVCFASAAGNRTTTSRPEGIFSRAVTVSASETRTPSAIKRSLPSGLSSASRCADFLEMTILPTMPSMDTAFPWSAT